MYCESLHHFVVPLPLTREALETLRFSEECPGFVEKPGHLCYIWSIQLKGEMLMKRMKILVFVLLCLLLLTACGGGTVRNVERDPGKSEI